MSRIVCEAVKIIKTEYDELLKKVKTPEEELLIDLGELILEQQHTGDWQFNDNSDVRKFTEICNMVKDHPTMSLSIKEKIKTLKDELLIELGKITYSGFNQTQGDYYEDAEVEICKKIREME